MKSILWDNKHLLYANYCNTVQLFKFCINTYNTWISERITKKFHFGKEGSYSHCFGKHVRVRDPQVLGVLRWNFRQRRRLCYKTCPCPFLWCYWLGNSTLAVPRVVDGSVHPRSWNEFRAICSAFPLHLTKTPS